MLRLLDELRLDVVQVLGAVVPHQGKVGLEQLLFVEVKSSVIWLLSRIIPFGSISGLRFQNARFYSFTLCASNQAEATRAFLLLPVKKLMK